MILDQCPHCGIRHVQANERFSDRLHGADADIWSLVRC
jgi:hypothetical protein